MNFWQNLPSMLDPVFVSIGPFEIRYYAIMYLVAFAVTYWLVKYRLRSEDTFRNFKLEVIQDYFMWAFLAVVGGGRIGYVLFYDLGYYISHPLQIIVPFDLSNGNFIGISGMSFHGGLICLIIVTLWYCRKNHLGLNEICALIVPAVPLGYMFGRIGNFLNNELWGRETEFWGAMLVNGSFRHPSQLYEAFFEGLILFILLWIFRNTSIVKRYSLELFLIGYGIARFFIEYAREPDAQIGLLWLNLTMGQILCMLMIIIGLVMIMAKTWLTNSGK